MEDEKVYHIKMVKDHHDNVWMWVAGLGALVTIWFGYNANTKLFNENDPFVIDLAKFEYQAEFDYKSRYEFVVRVEKPEGVEIQFYDPESGKLLGKVLDPAKGDQTSGS